MSLPFPVDVEETITSPSHIAHPNFSLKHACIFVSSLASIRKPFYSATSLHSSPQLTLAEAYHAFQMLRKAKVDAHISVDLSLENVSNALYLGFAETETTKEGAGKAIRLFVIFPRLKKDIRKEKALHNRWYKDVLEPALDSAWSEVHRKQRINSPAQDKYRDSGIIPGQDVDGHVAWPSSSMDNTGKEEENFHVLEHAWNRTKQAVVEDNLLRSLRDFLLVGIVQTIPAAPTNSSKKIIKRLNLEACLRPEFVDRAHLKIVSESPIAPQNSQGADDEERINIALEQASILQQTRKRKRDYTNIGRTPQAMEMSGKRSKTSSPAENNSNLIIDLTDS